MSKVTKPKSELEKSIEATEAATKTFVDLINKYTAAVNEYVEHFKPAEGTVRGDLVYYINRWVKLSDLDAEKRREKYKTFSDDELHDTVDNILDELYEREKKKAEEA